MENDLQLLKLMVDSVVPIPDSAWKDFASIWSPCSAGRKQILTEAGTHEKYLYFVLEGTQRVFYFDEHGREATLIFTYPPSFGGVLDAMMSGKPSRYNYQTLSPSRFLRTTYVQLDLLRQSHTSIADFMHCSLGAVVGGLLERMAELQCFSSEEKFRSLLSRSPHILQQVPHKYLANYLGIDPTNFSKLINSVVI